MTKTEITEIARQAGIEIPARTLTKLATRMNAWIDTEDETTIQAVDLFERAAEETYDADFEWAAALQDRCDTGEFDTWTIWEAA